MEGPFFSVGKAAEMLVMVAIEHRRTREVGTRVAPDFRPHREESSDCADDLHRRYRLADWKT